jgi:hypothetical protein
MGEFEFSVMAFLAHQVMIFSMARAIMRENVLILQPLPVVSRVPVRRCAEDGKRHAKLIFEAPSAGRLPFVTPTFPVLKLDNSGSAPSASSRTKNSQGQSAVRRLGGAFTKFVSRK